jgi:multicomponent K+:H+ antiporter subunit E
MTRWLPFPLVSASLLVMWLLLNQTLSAGHLMLGCILALVGPLTMAALDLPAGRPRRPRAILRLALLVLADIIRSNVAVARIILNPGQRNRTSGFVNIPLELRDPYALAVLACIITSTPGTIWVDFDSAKGALLIHVLDLIDESTWIRTIKHRYERLLLEIFE